MSRFTQGQLVIAVTLGVVIISLAAIIATLVLTGGTKSAAEVTFLIGIIGTLVGLFGAVLKLGQVSQQINGHVAQHEAEAEERTQRMTAESLQPMIDEAVRKTLAGQRQMAADIKQQINGGDH